MKQFTRHFCKVPEDEESFSYSLDANLIVKETKGTWSYYDLNDEEVNHLLSEELCCVF
ncbi:hypothetical protein Bcer98_2192 [Bacillus cytotoxicus NVH 391-98]|uniref:Uncharacterized protein n=1 Tax=Bacillus cytotoxicus (strain DSM 22905 / CIP 110041 / 391-98 / NVH 391-98) TaxID=315749 RepID=A7GQN4_BACCN|nr:hypothetical protein Bcer98_2192 [Bacillus cytotoxicus NVH 391-98]